MEEPNSNQQVSLSIGLKLKPCTDLSRSSDDEGDSKREIAPNSDDEDIQQIILNNQINLKQTKSTEDRLEEVSEQGSELYETDSSCGQDQDLEMIKIRALSPNHDFGQGFDIVAGSPTKHNRETTELDALEEGDKTPEDLKGREEMNGIIVYDSYAELTGNEKIVNYFQNKIYSKIDQTILFSKEEIKKTVKEVFTDRARERDFASEQDRTFFKNLPRFSAQRDFSNPQFEIYVPQQQNLLIFDSRFENGNLRKVAKVNNIEYNLWLENDLNTKGHTQWYYFKVIYKDIALRADKKSQKVKFSILNLAKTSSLYQVGMKPCIWSKKKFEQTGTGWFRGGEDVTYIQNDIQRETEFDVTLKMKDNLNNNNAFLYNNNGAGEGIETYFTLSFKYEFIANEEDEIYFAHAIPSTYTDMQTKLLELKDEPKYQEFMKMNVLCQTLAKIPVPLITITENVSTYLDYYEELKIMNQIPSIVKKAYRQKYSSAQKLAKQSEEARGRVQRLLQAAIEEEMKQFFEFNEDHLINTHVSFTGFDKRLTEYVRDHSQKQAIVFSSRVHPGEPQASHMLDGILKFFLSPEAENLRKHFVIRIIPMLNPDGVIYGNYRCSLLGCDLNRKWDKPNRLLHPPVYYTKNLIRYMHQERKVLLYCDLHGHSRKKNAFFYGCSYKNYEQEGRVRNAQLRLIPLMCCQKNNIFKLKDCRFRVEKTKESTARVVVFKEFNIANSFTLECSFFAHDTVIVEKNSMGKLQKKSLQQISLEEYNSLGSTICQVLTNFLPSEKHKLQFLSGKILDIFYEEFIKFVPPYILKREQEKQKKHLQESNPKTQNPKTHAIKQNSLDLNQNSNLSGGKLSRKQTQSYNTTNYMPVGIQGIRAIATGQKTHVTLVSIENPSGTDTELNEKIVSTDDILEFENFMAGIQNQKQDKQQDKLIRKQRMQEAEENGIDYVSEANSLSSGNSSDDEGFKKKKKKKKRQIPKTDKKPNDAKKIIQDLNNTMVIPSSKNKMMSSHSLSVKKNNSPRFSGASPVMLREESQISGHNHNPYQTTNNDQNNNLISQQVMSSAQIQNLIQSQLSTGALKQSEILLEIQRAILHNKQILQSQNKEPKMTLPVNGYRSIVSNELLPQITPKKHLYKDSLNSSAIASGDEQDQINKSPNFRQRFGVKEYDQFSPNPTSRNNLSQAQAQGKELNMSRNLIKNNEQHIVSGTFDQTKQVRQPQQVHNFNQNIFLKPTKPQLGVNQNSQQVIQNNDFSKNDFKKAQIYSFGNNPKIIQPILGMKSNNKQIYQTSQSQEHHQNMGQIVNNQQKIYMSPQGMQQSVNQKQFSNKIKFLPHNQFGKHIQNETTPAKNLYIVGKQNTDDLHYRRASADMNEILSTDRNGVENISNMIHSHNKTSPKKSKRNVMNDLKDQIAKESASLDLIQKQQQLQIQLERQQALLQQLQQQLNMQKSSNDVPPQIYQSQYKSPRNSNVGTIPREFINFNDEQTMRVSSNEWHIPTITKGGQSQVQSPQTDFKYFQKTNNQQNQVQNQAQNRMKKIIQPQQVQSTQNNRRSDAQIQSPQKYQVSNYVQNINVFVSDATYNQNKQQQPQRANTNMQMLSKVGITNPNPMNNAIIKQIDHETRKSQESLKKQYKGSHLNNKNFINSNQK